MPTQAPTKTTATKRPPAKKPAAKTPARKAPARKPAAKARAKKPASGPATPPERADDSLGGQMMLVEHAPLDRIAPHPDNIREELGDLDNLAASIRQRGVLQPLVVFRPTNPPAGVDFQLIAGHRRRAAALLAGLTDVPVIVRAEPTRVELFESMLAENNQRSALNPIEEALALREIKAAGRRSTKAIAAAVNRSEQWVRDRLALVDNLPEKVWDQVRTGEIGVTDATLIATTKGLNANERRKLASYEGAQLQSELRQALATARKRARRETVEKQWPGRAVVADNPEYRGLPKGHPAPMGAVRYGTKPGAINRVAVMDPPDHQVVHLDTWNLSAKPVVWHTAPHLLEAADFVPVEYRPDHVEALPLWTDVAGSYPDATLLSQLPADPGAASWAVHRPTAHQACPAHLEMLVPWQTAPLSICTNPAMHALDNPARVSWAELHDQHREQSATASGPAPVPARASSWREEWDPAHVQVLVDQVAATVNGLADGPLAALADLIYQTALQSFDRLLGVDDDNETTIDRDAVIDEFADYLALLVDDVPTSDPLPVERIVGRWFLQLCRGADVEPPAALARALEGDAGDEPDEGDDAA